MSEMKQIFDKNGTPILKGDLIKMFHYVAAVRRERIYMYKHVVDVQSYGHGTLFTLSHLGQKLDTYHVRAEGQVRDDWEVVQGFGADGTCYRYRTRVKVTK